MKKFKNVLKMTIILTALYFLISCNPIADDTQSSSLLIIVNLTGTDIEENDVNFLQSDVVRINKDTGEPYVTGDTAAVTFTAKLMDPNTEVTPSQYNDIQVTQYSVQYFRTDGNNIEGVHVPYAFTGSLSALVAIDTSVQVPFIIVREVAKLESPLIELRDGTEEVAITVTAKVEFFGHDLANNKVKATGYLTITFANFIDP